MKPRIAVILGRLVIGGTTMDTLQALQYLQHHFTILLITGGSSRGELEVAYLTDHLPQVQHIRINGFSGSLSLFSDWAAYRQIKKVLKHFKPQLVHTHTAKAGLLGRLAAASAGVPLVHTYHGMLFHGYYNACISRMIVYLERWLAKKTTCIIALSATQKHQLVSIYKIAAPTKISIVPIGIEVNTFVQDQSPKRKQFREQYQLEENEIAVGIIGRIVPIKNHLFFLQAVQQVLHHFPSTRFYIVGDGNLRKDLMQQCIQLGISATYFPENPCKAPLTFTSWITAVDVVISGLDIITLTSLNEGTPVSLMEAQAGGRPIVAIKAGGIEDIVLHGETGFTVEQSDLTAFIHYLEMLIEDTELRKQVGSAGAALAKKQFAKSQQVSKLHDLYSHLIS